MIDVINLDIGGAGSGPMRILEGSLGPPGAGPMRILSEAPSSGIQSPINLRSVDVLAGSNHDSWLADDNVPMAHERNDAEWGPSWSSDSLVLPSGSKFFFEGALWGLRSGSPSIDFQFHDGTSYVGVPGGSRGSTLLQRSCATPFYLSDGGETVSLKSTGDRPAGSSRLVPGSSVLVERIVGSGAANSWRVSSSFNTHETPAVDSPLLWADEIDNPDSISISSGVITLGSGKVWVLRAQIRCLGSQPVEPQFRFYDEDLSAYSGEGVESFVHGDYRGDAILVGVFDCTDGAREISIRNQASGSLVQLIRNRSFLEIRSVDKDGTGWAPGYWSAGSGTISSWSAGTAIDWDSSAEVTPEGPTITYDSASEEFQFPSGKWNVWVVAKITFDSIRFFVDGSAVGVDMHPPYQSGLGYYSDLRTPALHIDASAGQKNVKVVLNDAGGTLSRSDSYFIARRVA